MFSTMGAERPGAGRSPRRKTARGGLQSAAAAMAPVGLEQGGEKNKRPRNPNRAPWSVA